MPLPIYRLRRWLRGVPQRLGRSLLLLGAVLAAFLIYRAIVLPGWADVTRHMRLRHIALRLALDQDRHRAALMLARRLVDQGRERRCREG